MARRQDQKGLTGPPTSIGPRGATTGVRIGSIWMLVTPPLGISFFGAGITSGRTPPVAGLAVPHVSAESQQPLLWRRPFKRDQKLGLPHGSEQPVEQAATLAGLQQTTGAGLQ